jgi:hypothetical protein
LDTEISFFQNRVAIHLSLQAQTEASGG